MLTEKEYSYLSRKTQTLIVCNKNIQFIISLSRVSHQRIYFLFLCILILGQKNIIKEIIYFFKERKKIGCMKAFHLVSKEK